MSLVRALQRVHEAIAAVPERDLDVDVLAVGAEHVEQDAQPVVLAQHLVDLGERMTVSCPSLTRTRRWSVSSETSSPLWVRVES